MAASAAAGRGVAVPGKRECMALLGALLVVVALAEPAAAAEYTVGDATRWTTQGSPNYTAWAVSKTFRVGDTIVFLYNSLYHNVLEVSQSRYEACNTTNPISNHTTGNDSFILKTAGHRYFLCGIPGHCTLGQRVDVNVLSSSTPAPSTPATASVPSASPPSPSAASPSVGSGHYVAGCFVALLAAAMSLSL